MISEAERRSLRRRAEIGSFSEDDAHRVLDELNRAYAMLADTELRAGLFRCDHPGCKVVFFLDAATGAENLRRHKKAMHPA